MEENRKLVAIDYGRPAPPIAASRVLAGVLCVPAAFIGLAGTAVGVINWVGYFLLDEWPTHNRPDNAAYSTIMLLIGLTFSFVAIRCARYAMRGSWEGRMKNGG